MDADFKKIKKLTDFMKKSGLLHLKQGEIELTLSPDAILQDEPKATSPVADEATSPNEFNNTEDALYWSAPGGEIPETEGNLQ